MKVRVLIGVIAGLMTLLTQAGSIDVNGVTVNYEVANGGVYISGYGSCSAIPQDTEGSLVLPSSVSVETSEYDAATGKYIPITNVYDVCEIYANAFSSCASLTEVVIPNSVTNIGYSAFAGCTSLRSVSLSESLSEISANLFENCTSLTNVVIPASVTAIRANAFSGCTALKEIALPSSVRIIEPGAFAGCTGLKSIVVPAGVSFPDAYSGEWNTTGVFQNCTGLETVSFGKAVQTIGRNMFRGCRRLKTVFLSDGLESIQPGAFSSCFSLSELVLPEGLNRLGVVPNERMRIINDSYTLYSWTTTQASPGTIDNCEDGVFFRCSKLKTLVVPQTVELLGEYAFAGCSSLEGVEFLGDEPTVCSRDPATNDFACCSWNLFLNTPTSLVVSVRKDAEGWYDPISLERLQTWYGRVVSYEGERVIPAGDVSVENVKAQMSTCISFFTTSGATLSAGEANDYVRWGRQIVERWPECRPEYRELVTAVGASMTAAELSAMTVWAASGTSKAVSGGGLVVTNVASGGTTSGTVRPETGSTANSADVPQTVMANLTVTNIVLHYVQNVETMPALETHPEDGLVAVVSEIVGSTMVPVPCSWTNAYPQFVEMYGTDFAAALMKPSGKTDASGAPLFVWQDYVAGTDPTDPASQFRATISFVEGSPVIGYSPKLETRVYRVWGKANLNDAAWSEIAPGSESAYRFFRVTVEMP